MHTKQENVYTNIINWNANINANAKAKPKETNEIWKQQIMYTDKKRARAKDRHQLQLQSEKSEKETDRLSIFIQRSIEVK